VKGRNTLSWEEKIHLRCLVCGPFGAVDRRENRLDDAAGDRPGKKHKFRQVMRPCRHFSVRMPEQKICLNEIPCDSGVVVGHGRVVLDIARAMHVFDDIVFFDNNPPSDGRILNARVLSGRIEQAGLAATTEFIIAIGSNHRRKDRYFEALQGGYTPATCIHPTGLISPSATIWRRNSGDAPRCYTGRRGA